MKKYSALFSPAYIGKLLIKNRIVMAPMLSGYAMADGEVSEQLIDYYEARARGGVGLIIVEAACVDSPTGRETFRQLNINNPRFIAGLEGLAQQIKAYGSRVFIQLFHAGRQTSSSFTGVQPVAPSPLACPMIKEIPRELSITEIKEIEKSFINAAGYAFMAGFDGVELHAAHGYLINQFLSSHSNARKDEYGGTLENRMRFLMEIVEKIKESFPGLLLSVRLNIDDFVPGGLDLQESIEISRKLEQAGVDAIDCSSGTYESGLKSIEPSSYKEGWRVYLAAEVKKELNIPVIGGGMLSNPAFCNQLVKSKQTDFVFLGRTFIADGEWANKVREERLEDIRPCIRCNNCIDNNFKGLMLDCTVNPGTGREKGFSYYAKNLSDSISAVVVGSGPAGMQAALSLRERGAAVTLYEKDEKMGGLMNLASIPPYKYRIALLRDYLIGQIKKSGVDVLLNHPFDLEELQEKNPDYLILACGSQAVVPQIPGSDMDFCLGLRDVLERRVEIYNKDVLIAGGGSNGCEVADFLLQGGNRLAVVEQGDILAMGMEKKNRRDLLNRLEKGQVRKMIRSQVIEITAGQVLIADKQGGWEIIPADYLVWAAGFRPDNDLYFRAQKVHNNVFVIGDAFQVSGFKDAILQGQMIADMIKADL